MTFEEVLEVKNDLEVAIKQAEIILQNKKEYRNKIIKKLRQEAPLKYRNKADYIIKHIPELVKRAILKDEIEVKLCKLDIDKDFINRDCGSADPRPGSFGEYFHNRLNELGFTSWCRWDVHSEWPTFLGKMRYWAWMSISLTDLPVERNETK